MAYKVSNPEENKKHMADARSGPPFLKLQSGKNGKIKKTWIRILPVRDDHPNDTFYLWQRVHFSVGQNNRSIACLQPLEQMCPVCAEVQRLEAEGFKKEAAEMYGKWRCMMNVVEYDDDGKLDDTIKVWSVGRDTMNLIDNKTEGLSVDDPENGYDIWVERRGTATEDVRYSLDVDDEPRALDVDDDFFDGLHDLTTVYAAMEPAKVLTLLTAGGLVDPWEDEDAIEGVFEEVPALPAARGRRSEPEADDLPLPDPDLKVETRGRAAPASRNSSAPARPSRSGSETGRTSAPARGRAPSATSSGPSRPGRGPAAGGEDPAAARRRLQEVLNTEDEPEEVAEEEDE